MEKLQNSAREISRKTADFTKNRPLSGSLREMAK